MKNRLDTTQQYRKLFYEMLQFCAPITCFNAFYEITIYILTDPETTSRLRIAIQKCLRHINKLSVRYLCSHLQG